MKFLDLLWDEQIAKGRAGAFDMRVKLDDPAARELLSPATITDIQHNCRAFADLVALHPAGGGKCMIMLRLTRAPVPGCISFHRYDYGDNHVGETSRIIQYTLNGDDEYQGGRLCFVNGDGVLHMPKRPAGSMTIHGADIMHGVTKLQGGSQYSLFVLDCGDGLGDKQVVNASVDDVKRLLDPASATWDTADANGMAPGTAPAASTLDEEGVPVSALMQQGFRRPLAQFLAQNAFDSQPLLLRALIGLGAVTMEDVQYGLTEGGLTAAQLEQRGCPPLPAGRFIGAAAAVNPNTKAARSWWGF
jgi:hypothetical protein